MAKTTTKNTTQSNKAKQSVAKRADKSLTQKLRDANANRTKRKKEDKRRKQTEHARQEKAKQEAIREHALKQVNEAVLKSKRRSSRPLLMILLALVLVGLAGTIVYQYREIELDKKQVIISELKSDIVEYEELRSKVEADKQREENKLKTIKLQNNATIRVPKEWSFKPSQIPQEEQMLGDENVTLRIVSSKSRDSIEQYMPKLDYLWTITGDDSPRVSSKSLHCERFDVLSNDLNNELREHKGFSVYCDESSERVAIAALATPQKYGLTQSNTYFIIEIEDLQQIDFDDIQSYLESFSAQYNTILP